MYLFGSANYWLGITSLTYSKRFILVMVTDKPEPVPKKNRNGTLDGTLVHGWAPPACIQIDTIIYTNPATGMRESEETQKKRTWTRRTGEHAKLHADSKQSSESNPGSVGQQRNVSCCAAGFAAP